MSPQDRLRLDRLLLAAAALDPGEQTAFLDRLTADDSALAGEVRRCLRAAEDLPESFLRGPAIDLLEAVAAEAEAPKPQPPASDERYEIGECLGAGGMARVYRAFDRRLGRPVALKILHATDPETPRRLLREARAQARVRHEHVVDVYETGELDGRPYIAVRHVAGGTLADLGDSASLEQKVRLVAQVAEGLHAAHREGLLHGDVKPSNVLVEETPDGDLRAWIGDFGIATELAEKGSETAVLAGTPQFMAPELLRGNRASADRRSDVFSLGVTLHQLLTGGLPPGGAHWAVLRERAPRLPPDLAAIVARCLAEDPGDRYPSARAVAEDLQRFLDGEVVEAYADRLVYRLSRFAGRHRALLAVAGVAAVLLAAALVVAAVMGVQAVRANMRADQRRAQAEELIDYTLLDLRDKLEPVGRLDLLDDVGERAMRYFAAVPEAELSDQELARRSVALYQIGDVHMRRGDLAGAERPLAESLALARQLAARDPDNPERLFDLGQSEFWAGYAYWQRGVLAAARRHFEAYHEVSERLVAIDSENLDWQLELSYADSNLGSVLQVQGNLEEALLRFREALAVNQRLVDEARDQKQADDWRFELAATHNTIGVVLEQLGRLDGAREHYEADLVLRRELVARDPANQRWREFLGTSYEYLGSLLLARGETAAARPSLEAGRDLFDELAERDPDNSDWRLKQTRSYLKLGQLEHLEGRPQSARAAWLRADAIAREMVDADPEHLAWRRIFGITRLHVAMARRSEAAGAGRPELLSALEVLEPLGAERPDDRSAHRWLAQALLLLGDVEAARGDPQASMRAWTRAAEALAPFVATGTRDHEILAPWARVLARLGRDAEAERAAAALDAIGYRGPFSPVDP